LIRSLIFIQASRSRIIFETFCIPTRVVAKACGVPNKMAYVPPHKRLGSIDSNRKNQRVNQSHNSALGADKASVFERFDPRVNSKHNDSASTDEKFFCEAFSFIRCINLAKRPREWDRFCERGRKIGSRFFEKVLRFDAIDGEEVVQKVQGDRNEGKLGAGRIGIDVALEWETTQNSLWDRHVAPGTIRQLTPGEIGCALSHVSLWKELAANQPKGHRGSMMSRLESTRNENEREATLQQQPPSLSMLILEDDVMFVEGRKEYHSKEYSKPGFVRAFRKAHDILPGGWDIFYIGFSDRGERIDTITSSTDHDCDEGGDDLVVQVFKPTYGFHTHAYAIQQSAAQRLLQNLPVVGPIDVWLADNQWFGLKAYCAIVANEGWKKKGAPLVGQDRNKSTRSSVGQSGR